MLKIKKNVFLLLQQMHNSKIRNMHQLTRDHSRCSSRCCNVGMKAAIAPAPVDCLTLPQAMQHFLPPFQESGKRTGGRDLQAARS